MFGTLFPSQSIAPPPPLSATLPIKLFAKSSTFDALTRRAAPPSPKAAVYTTQRGVCVCVLHMYMRALYSICVCVCVCLLYCLCVYMYV